MASDLVEDDRTLPLLDLLDAEHAPEQAVSSFQAPHRRARTALLLLLGLGAAAARCTLMLAASSHAVLPNSDSATVALEGDALRHGNLTLSGWALSLDSFWTVDAPVYAIGAALIGLTPLLINLIPALLAVGVIALGIHAARWGLRGRSAVVAGAMVVALLGLPTHTLALFFLQGPWHIGTALWCLGAFVALRASRIRFGWLIAALLLAAGLLGDLQTLGFGVLPVALAGLVAMRRERRWSAGRDELIAAAGGVFTAILVRVLTSYFGAFTFHEAHNTASAARMWSDFGHLGSWGLAMLGITPGPFGGPSVPATIRIAHLLVALVILTGVLVALASTARGIRRGAPGSHPGWQLDDLLLFALLADLGEFEVLTLSDNVQYARYLIVAVIFASILAARWVGRTMERLPSGWIPPAAFVTALALVGGSVAEIVNDLRTPAPKDPVVQLTSYLTAEHLTNGIADYWAASVVTVETHGQITVRPVVSDPSGKLVRDGRQSDAAWYANQRFQFLVYETKPYGRVDHAAVIATFGQPSQTKRIGDYFVLRWDRPLVLPDGQFP